MVGTDQEAFAEQYHVSRETIAKLALYDTLIKKWNPAINLVAPSTLDYVWSRHFSESAEVLCIAGDVSGRWADLGTGGGFPGAVVAILANGASRRMSVTCIDSDIRKCAFLRTVARETATSIGILSRRIVEAPRQGACVVSARALAPLPRLLEHAVRHLAPDGRAIFPKGKTWRSEVQEAELMWNFDLKVHASPTSSESKILELRNIRRV